MAGVVAMASLVSATLEAGGVARDLGDFRLSCGVMDTLVTRKLRYGLLAALVLSGCSGYAPFSEDGQYLQGTAGPGVVSRDRSPIPDVPMPIGFVPVVDKCRSDVVAGARHIHHFYQGRAKGQDVVDFYRRSLKLYDWQLGREGTDADTYTMRFSKGPEAMSIAVRQQLFRTTIEIIVMPREQMPSMPGASGTPAKSPSSSPNVNLGAMG